MSLSELQCQKLIVKMFLQNPNKSKSETTGIQDSYYLSYINKRFDKQERVERKIGSGKKCSLSSSKVHAALKTQTAGRSAKSYLELGWKIQVQHITVKKYLTKMRVHHKAKKRT
jgi:hypothetical protein